MDLFVSKYINKIDKKGRVSLPSSFRNVLPKSNRNEIEYKNIVLAKHKIEWQWVKGHSGDIGNETADMLANRGIDEL